MARHFNGTSDIMFRDGVDFSGVNGIYTSAWLYRDDNTQASRIIFEYAQTRGFDVVANSSAGKDSIRYYSTGANWSDTYPSPAAGAWHHYIWYISGAATLPPSNAVWIDGVAQTLTPVTHTATPLQAYDANQPLTFMGRRIAGVNSLFLGGRIAEICMAGALSANAILGAVAGFTAYDARYDQCILYAPVIGDSPEPDCHGGGHLNLTVTGTTVVNHPSTRTLFACR